MANIQQALRQEGLYVSIAAGNSMYPMLRGGRDTVVIRPVGEKPLCPYDVALYQRDDGVYVLHRVIKVLPNQYLIRGDNNIETEHVPCDEVIGVLTEFYRGEQHILVHDRGYLMYVHLWCMSFPVRKIWRRVLGLLSRFKHRVRG